MTKIKPGADWLTRETASRVGDVVFATLWYPGTEPCTRYVNVGLAHVRAADEIRISYDFERDGYKIEQASVFEWEANDEVMDRDWQEVAFIKAWGREKLRQEDT